MILILTLDDIPPELQHLPIDGHTTRRLPEHVRDCITQATTVLLATQIKCRGPGCKEPSAHVMTPVALSEREEALLRGEASRPVNFNPASAADLRALLSKRILIRLLGRNEIYETEVHAFSPSDRFVELYTLSVGGACLGWRHVEDVMVLEVLEVPKP